MTSEELRAIQAPLKEQYKTDPATAVVTLRAHSRMSDGIACKVETHGALVEAGLHPATGGDSSQVCSGELLLEALAACAGVTLQAVATAINIPLKDFRVLIEGDLDFRGTLGVSKEVPVGFRNIRLAFELDANDTEERIAKLIELTERYCVVLQSLKSAPEISISCSNEKTIPQAPPD